jgi:DnaJ-domain-containing protein 1
MHLPSRLRSTTLGDLLGRLHRARANGTLELVEDRGRVHRVHLAGGLLVAVELDGASPSLAEILRSERAANDDVLRRSFLLAIASRRLHGEVLISEFRVSPALVASALRRQVAARLAAIDGLGDARVMFRVALRPPRWALERAPLDAKEFLHGRRRAREASPADLPATGSATEESNAWRLLGISPKTDMAGIKRAYRQLVRAVHPDLHPGATEDQRHALEARFVKITEAYRLCAESSLDVPPRLYPS